MENLTVRFVDYKIEEKKGQLNALKSSALKIRNDLDCALRPEVYKLEGDDYGSSCDDVFISDALSIF